MPRPLLVILLSGCVGLDYLNEFDTGTPVGPGGQDTGASALNKPQVLSFSVEETDTKVRMNFEVTDIDNDMFGGSIEVTIGPRSYSYEFPTEVVLDGGETFLLYDKGDFTPQQQVNCTLRAVDSQGLSSSPSSTTFMLSASDLVVPETGDTAADIYDIGPISPPVTVQGSIWGAGNLGGLYDADLDFVSFSVPQSRTYSLSLTWTPTSADYDLHLIDGTGLTLAYATGYNQPEIVTYALNANTTYYFTVAAWDGSAGNWSVQIQ